MKRLVTALLAGLPLSVATAMPPFHSGTKDMQTILPVVTGCNLSLGSDTIDYGSQSRGQLQDANTAHNSLTLGRRTLIINVTCPYAQAMHLNLRGERGNNGHLRFGRRGHLAIRLFDAQLDGVSVLMVQTTPDGTFNTTAALSLPLKPGQTFSPVTGSYLAQGKVFTANLEIEPILFEADTRVNTPQVSQATFTLDLMN